MSDDQKDDEPGIFRVETIPPPDGEDDAYSAPTKVGPMADAAVKELMHAAERRATELSQRNADKAKAAKASAAAPTKPPPPVAPPSPAAAAPAEEQPAAPAAPQHAAVSSMPPNRGPVTGRAPAPVVGPVGRTVSSPPAASAKPPSGPKPPRAPAPRPDDAHRAAPAVPAPPPKKPAPIEQTPALSGDPIATMPDARPADAVEDASPPRLYDDNDDENAATLLHASAKPPRQEHTAPIPAPPVAPSLMAAPPAAPLAEAPVVRPREPIPFDRPLAPPLGEPEPPRVLIMPLVVGFLIFAIGLAFYIWAR